jgi:hypothetical protein
MSELLMFNAKTLEQRFLNPHNRQEIESLKEQGWIQNPTLVHMHHPRLNKDVNIMVQDRTLWEEKGYYAEPTMIYHPNDGTRMVSAEDAKKALKNGWYASPAHFPGNDVGRLKTLVLKEAS